MSGSTAGTERGPGALLRDEEGSVLILVAFALLGLLAIASFAIDLGIMYTARNESQNVADGAALAGAGILILSPGNVTGARAEAKKFALENHVRGQPVTLQDEDIQVMPAEDKVRVWVRNCNGNCGDSNVGVARSNPISTFFARMVGIQDVDVVTMAAAEAFPAGGAECMIPIVLPDRWTEYVTNDPDGSNDCRQNSGDCADRYDSPSNEPVSDDHYVPWLDPSTGNANSNYTGYAEDDYGLEISIRQPQQPGGGEINPSWYLHWVFDDNRGGAAFRDAWYNCDPTIKAGLGDVVTTEPGSAVGPLRQGVDSLLSMDNTFWDATQQCPVLTLGGSCHFGSPRIRPMPMFDPETEADLGNGRKQFSISNFANVYIADRQGTEVTVYFMGYGGVAAPVPSGGGAPPLFKFLRLVE